MVVDGCRSFLVLVTRFSNHFSKAGHMKKMIVKTMIYLFLNRNFALKLKSTSEHNYQTFKKIKAKSSFGCHKIWRAGMWPPVMDKTLTFQSMDYPKLWTTL